MRSIDFRVSLGEANALGRVFRSGALLLLLTCSFVALFVTGSWGAIPAAERTVLLNLYTATNGAAWTNSTNWNGGVGTECTWFGVTCNPGDTHVTFINLPSNNLVGSLPDLSDLTNLMRFDVGSNQLTGSIPSLSGLTNLLSFGAAFNQLSGSIPSLSGLTNLQYFIVSHNQLSGAIPSLSGLTNLQNFDVGHNQLSGSLPSLSGLTNLLVFSVSVNQLSGSIPSLSGLTNLQNFHVDNNQLTGDVPDVPSPNNLLGHSSGLCPNYLNHTPNIAWDVATGVSPWYIACTAPPAPVSIPTLNECGMIIFMVLAGIGSVYYLRRQRRKES